MTAPGADGEEPAAEPAADRAGRAAAPEFDADHEERRNVTTLLRWVGGFLAWPGLSIAAVFLLDLEGHVGHFLLSLMFGLLGIAVLVAARRIALHFYPVTT